MIGFDSSVLSFVNIVSLAEAGFSVTLIVYLVGPLFKDNWEDVNVYLNTFRIVYKYMGIIYIIFSLIGGMLLPFYIKDLEITPKLYLYYFMNCIIGGMAYYLSYRHILLKADRKQYVEYAIKMFCVAAVSILQLMKSDRTLVTSVVS